MRMSKGRDKSSSGLCTGTRAAAPPGGHSLLVQNSLLLLGHPLQKAQVVELVKKHKQAVTLDIGDGANYVSMNKSRIIMTILNFLSLCLCVCVLVFTYSLFSH